MNEKFVEKLVGLDNEKNRAALAVIRRAAADPDADFQMLSVIGRFLPSDLHHNDLNNHKRVACLFAIHKLHDGKKNFNFGDSCRMIWNGLHTGQDSFEARFAALLNSHPDDLYRRLLPIVRYAKDKDVKINFDQLREDMQNWSHPDKFVQKNWAKQFWTIRKKDSETEE
jgi:CRISPR type I-E-associated protein CasB/Cse2